MEKRLADYMRKDLCIQLYLVIHEQLETGRITVNGLYYALGCVRYLSTRPSTWDLIRNSIITAMQNWLDTQQATRAAQGLSSIFAICWNQWRLPEVANLDDNSKEKRRIQSLVKQVAQKTQGGMRSLRDRLCLREVLRNYVTGEELAELLAR
jgi:uncharacterized protein (DUF2267 family)